MTGNDKNGQWTYMSSPHTWADPHSSFGLGWVIHYLPYNAFHPKTMVCGTVTLGRANLWFWTCDQWRDATRMIQFRVFHWPRNSPSSTLHWFCPHPGEPLIFMLLHGLACDKTQSWPCWIHLTEEHELKGLVGSIAWMYLLLFVQGLFIYSHRQLVASKSWQFWRATIIILCRRAFCGHVLDSTNIFQSCS